MTFEELKEIYPEYMLRPYDLDFSGIMVDVGLLDKVLGWLRCLGIRGSVYPKGGDVSIHINGNLAWLEISLDGSIAYGSYGTDFIDDDLILSTFPLRFSSYTILEPYLFIGDYPEQSITFESVITYFQPARLVKSSSEL